MNITLTDTEAKRFLAERFDISPADITIRREVNVVQTVDNLIDLVDFMSRTINGNTVFEDKIDLIRRITATLGTTLSQSRDIAERLILESEKI